MRGLTLSLALLIGASPMAALAAPPLVDAPVIYSMKRNDTLYGIAQQHFTRVDGFLVVQRLNRVTNPRRMPVGFQLTIPRELLRITPIDARVQAFRGEVTIARQGAATPVTVGAVLREGDQIQTAANAFVTLRLADGSAVSLPSSSLIEVTRLRRVEMTGQIDRVFTLKQGRSRSVVRPMTEPGNRFEIRTPLSVAAVRGTDFRVALMDADTATTEVIEGRVEVVSEDGALVAVPAAFGAVTEPAGTSPARPLLPAPELLRPGAVQNEPELAFQVAPNPAAAGGHRVQLATDAGFIDVFAETTTTDGQAAFASLPNGGYFVRVTAIDEAGLEGMPRTYSFRRYLNSLRTEAQRLSGDDEGYLFRWQAFGTGERLYRFVLRQVGSAGPPVVDEPGLTAETLTVGALPPGEYVWSVQTRVTEGGEVQVNWSPEEQLTISPPSR